MVALQRCGAYPTSNLLGWMLAARSTHRNTHCCIGDCDELEFSRKKNCSSYIRERLQLTMREKQAAIDLAQIIAISLKARCPSEIFRVNSLFAFVEETD